MGRNVAACLVVLALWAPGLARAELAEVRPVDDGAVGGEATQAYPGVVPGTGAQPPRARLLARTRHNYVTWPGFEEGSSGSRIFVQTTRPVTYSRADEGTSIVLVLPRTRIHLRNNRNPLVTEHFNTPVSRAYLRRRGRDTLLVLEMKVGAEPRISQSSEGEYQFLFVEFPPGDYPVPAGSTPTEVRGEEREGQRTSEESGLSVQSVD
jgi:hypothetical protein